MRKSEGMHDTTKGNACTQEPDIIRQRPEQLLSDVETTANAPVPPAPRELSADGLPSEFMACTHQVTCDSLFTIRGSPPSVFVLLVGASSRCPGSVPPRWHLCASAHVSLTFACRPVCLSFTPDSRPQLRAKRPPAQLVIRMRLKSSCAETVSLWPSSDPGSHPGNWREAGPTVAPSRPSCLPAPVPRGLGPPGLFSLLVLPGPLLGMSRCRDSCRDGLPCDTCAREQPQRPSATGRDPTRRVLPSAKETMGGNLKHSTAAIYSFPVKSTLPGFLGGCMRW
uniref:uncharacterized protein LOC129516324 isoform X2 n=1 Tax=Nyctereutes procyonoides TaxID=34880 RepID=UPI002444FCBD|nr:uncharacterized protein LOC129516324 isoform X2 [Nyctereutes procyonoides]